MARDVQTCTNGVLPNHRHATVECGQQQTMSHIVDSFLLTKFEGRLQLLYELKKSSQVVRTYCNYSICEMKSRRLMFRFPFIHS